MMTRRQIVYTLNFTMKTYLFGPVGTSNVITKVTANLVDTDDASKKYETYVATATMNETTTDPTDYDVIEGWDD